MDLSLSLSQNKNGVSAHMSHPKKERKEGRTEGKEERIKWKGNKRKRKGKTEGRKETGSKCFSG
jgi:hypothetical protein